MQKITLLLFRRRNWLHLLIYGLQDGQVAQKKLNKGEKMRIRNEDGSGSEINIACYHQAPAESQDIPGSRDFFQIPMLGVSKI